MDEEGREEWVVREEAEIQPSVGKLLNVAVAPVNQLFILVNNHSIAGFILRGRYDHVCKRIQQLIQQPGA